MSQSTVAERQNKVSVADAGPSRKKLTIEIPAESVAERLKESFDTLAIEAELPGFRKGHVPRWLIEKRFATVVKKEARGQLVASAYNKAVEDLNLRVVSGPHAGKDTEEDLDPSKPLKVDLEVEVMPEFELPALEGIDVLRPTFEVTDQTVEDELKKMQINEGSLESRESSEPGDYLTGHAVMTGKDGVEYYNLKGAVVQKPAADKGGKGMILGIAVDDFDSQMGSPKVGDSFTVKCKGPENHEVEGIRSADLTVKFEVERIDRIIPATAQRIVDLLGMEDESRLRNFIRQRLAQNVVVQQQTAMRQQISKFLVENVKMDLPERMTAAQTERTLQRRRLELMYRGFEPHHIEEHMAELRKSSSEAAARDLKSFFILSKVSEQLKVRVDDGEINARIAQMAVQRGMRPEQLRQDLIRGGQVGGIYMQIRDHKTLDLLASKAKVTDISAEEYNKRIKAESVAAF